MIQRCRRSFLSAFTQSKKCATSTNFKKSFETSASYGQKFSISKNKKKKTVEISYEEESNKYLLKELLNSQKAFYLENQKLSEISSQFKEVLQLYGLTLQKAPLKEAVSFFEEGIHLSKKVEHMNYDLLLDYRKSPETDSREVQIVVSNSMNSDYVLYCMGQFTKNDGILFDSAILISTQQLGKSSQQVRDAICNSEKWIFNELNSYYQKPLEISLESIRKFLLSNIEEDYDFSEMQGRVFVDALLNFYLLESLDLRASNPDSAKVRNILWLLANYSETCLQEKWLSNLVSFIK
ncbi:hypothetical protein CANINC_002530 [Pichia inconspicua]|uniref:Uncharacterized protein n=1 Tax=Pichia inconspicua TaxID=52247 RepID=A0A4T0X2K9_9ASCO|nr:hypothetical protein CANINC_002530 [[Candida] inconspicua]